MSPPSSGPDASGAARLSVRPGEVGSAALCRLIGIVAARAQLTVDAVDRAMEIAAILASHAGGELAPGSARLDIAAQPRPGHLSIAAGVFREGGGERLLAAGQGRITIRDLATVAVPLVDPEGERVSIELADIAPVAPSPGSAGSVRAMPDASRGEVPTDDFAITSAGDPSGAHVVAIRGEIDIFTAPSVKLAAREAVFAGCRRIVLDLTDTTFLDSTGLGVVIGLARLVRPDGEIAIVNVNPTIAKTFEITGLDDIYIVRPTLSQALAALANS
jgi:anti-sigma B factor antagonist